MAPAPKPKTVRDPAYLKWVRQQPCWFARFGFMECCYDFSLVGNWQREVSHLRGRNDDGCVLPSCPGHHRTNKVSWHHGQRTFCQYYGVTKAEMIQQAEALYASYLESR